MTLQVEGRNPVLEVIRSGQKIEKLYVEKGSKKGSILDIIVEAEKKNIPIQYMDKTKLQGITKSKNNQGVICICPDYKYTDIDDILEKARKKNEQPFIIMLDEINDVHNFGSIIRTCETAGVHGIIIPKRRSVGVTPAAIKVSAGATEYMDIAVVTNLNRTIEQLKGKGLWIVGADLKGENYYETDFNKPICIVIGSEGKGLSRLVKENCDFLVSIKMKGKISSLNASNASAILIYEVVRQRDKSS